MQEVELKIGNTQIKLSCENPKKLLDLTEKLSSKVDEIKSHSKNISDTKAFLVTSLHLIDEIEILNRNLQDLKANFYDQFENEKKSLANEYELIAEEINNISALLKKLDS
ncbi:cell division protein ZapA [Candidatus Bandiella numerosa]|uniref:cell division protein ZapA n=1 Tax=Candidatus Bandiella numerosa TaxID=2570586 RepID=UPI001F01A7CD|nr:cell division protein ZapA [Candidatus Bandiella numerosa]